MPAISYSKAPSGDLLVKAPYHMKDLFKKSFRGMKCLPDQKVWKLPASREKRLKSWSDVVNTEAPDLDARLDARDQEELNESEVVLLRVDLEKLQRELGDREEHRGTLEKLTAERRELLARMEELRHQVDAARAPKEAAQVEANAEAERLHEIIKGVCDMNKVFAARDEMSSIISKRGPLLSHDKATYRKAQSVVEEEHERLKAIGWGSRGLHRLSNMYPNRPDRDHPDAIDMDDVLDLVEVQPERDLAPTR